MISEQNFLKLKNEIEKHDQFPIQYFYNLTSLDIKLVDWGNLKLVFKDNMATLSQGGYDLQLTLDDIPMIYNNLSYDHADIIFEPGDEFILEPVEYMFENDFPPIFMNDEQIKENLKYLKEILSPIFSSIGLNIEAAEEDLSPFFYFNY